MSLMLSTIEQERRRIKHFIESRIQAHFEKDFVDFSKRIRIESDLEKWRPEIEEIWAQKKGTKAHWFSIYFDDEFVCSFPMDLPPSHVEVLMLKKLADLFESGTICFDTQEYIIKAELERLKQKDADDKLQKELASQPQEVRAVIKELNAETA